MPTEKETLTASEHSRHAAPLRRRSRAAPALLLAMVVVALPACDGAGSPVEIPQPPEITVVGVADGATYDGPVTIAIEVDRGAYSARLNGAPFFSGGTVTQPGEYTLEVSAVAAGVQSTEHVDFAIAFAGERVLILRMIDLGPHVPWGGGGDALLLTDSSAAGLRHGLVDAGPGGFQADVVNYDFVAKRLGSLGVDTLEFLQLTHAHADHYAGIQTVLDSVHVRRFLYNGQTRTLAGYVNTLSRAEQRADSVFVPDETWAFDLGIGAGATRTLHLPPLPDHLDTDTNDSHMLNDGSIGTVVEQGGIRMLLTGDGEDGANTRWRTEYAQLTEAVDILKVGHHGANNAIFDDRVGASPASSWLDHTRPRIRLISANGVSHPRVRALERLLGVPETETYCTSVHGTIEVRVAEDGRVSIRTERNAGQDCVPGDDANT